MLLKHVVGGEDPGEYKPRLLPLKRGRGYSNESQREKNVGKRVVQSEPLQGGKYETERPTDSQKGNTSGNNSHRGRSAENGRD